MSLTDMGDPTDRGIKRYLETTAVGVAFSDYLNKGLNAVDAALTAMLNDSGWITPTLNAGWTAAGGEAPAYRRVLGVVYLRGRATTTGGAATAYTLPLGFRPAINVVGTTDANGAAVRYVVNATGTVGQAAAAANTAWSFGGIRPFLAEA